MQYRKFGRDGWKGSVLGFGAMRLPTMSNGSDIHEQEAIQMIRHGIDNGVNYIDTAYMYHNGESEVIVGRALRDGYREKVRVATKSPGHLIKSPGDFDKILDEQLKRLDMPYVDYYLFHGIGNSGLEQIKTLGLFRKMEDAVRDGRVKHSGFSFHDDLNAFKRIVDSYDWEFCQIQFNYMDTKNQAGTEGLRYAANRGISVVIMEPLLGGRLARPPQPVAQLFSESGSSRSAADWALHWIWNHPEVSIVLSGMSNMEQVRQNIAAAESAVPGMLSSGEISVVKRVQQEFASRTIIPCTKCRYCMPCPSGVDIPWNLEQYNEGIIYGDPGSPRFVYNTFIKPENRASQCSGCQICLEKCPQKINAGDWMPLIEAVLGEGKPYPEDDMKTCVN
ncbi:MAG: aldo/keto reductase [Fibrobacter sp.]|nr:aldo/keto reductase [Fibrobacter sp.]